MSRSSAAAAAPADAAELLFEHQARRDGKVIAVLRGTTGPENGFTVEAEIHPLGRKRADPVKRPFTFASRQHADRFVDEALLCLQYLNCTLPESS